MSAIRYRLLVISATYATMTTTGSASPVASEVEIACRRATIHRPPMSDWSSEKRRISVPDTGGRTPIDEETQERHLAPQPRSIATDLKNPCGFSDSTGA